MKIHFLLIFILSFSVSAKKLTPAEIEVVKTDIKTKLERDIHQNYIPQLEELWGDCEDGNCLEKKEGSYKIKLPKKDICLPYSSCGYYKCMEEKYQCKSVGVNYFSDLAFPTCSAYGRNINRSKFTKKGIQWIYSVMVCLQKGLTDECENKENCSFSTRKETCDHITKFTLDFHPGCYLNSGIGVCKLPLKDKISIFKTVVKYMTKDERKQAYRTIFKCLKN